MVWWNPTTWFSKPKVTTTTITPVVVTPPPVHGTPISSPVPTAQEIATTPTYVPSSRGGGGGSSYVPPEFIPKPGLPTSTTQPTTTSVPIPEVFRPQPNRLTPGTSSKQTTTTGKIPPEFIPKPGLPTPIQSFSSRNQQIIPSTFQQTGISQPTPGGSSMIDVASPSLNLLGTGMSPPPPRFNLDLFKKAGRELFFVEGTPIDAFGTLASPFGSSKKKLYETTITGNVFGTIQDNSSTSPFGSGGGRKTTELDILKTQAIIDPNLLVPVNVQYQREADKISKKLISDIQPRIDTGEITLPEAEKEFKLKFEEGVGKIDMNQFTPSISYKERVRQGGQPIFDVPEIVKFGAFVGGSFTPVGQVLVGASLVSSSQQKLGKGILGTDLTLKERGILLGTGVFEAGIGLGIGGGSVKMVERQADRLLVKELMDKEGTITGKELFKAKDFTLFKTTSRKSFGQEARIETGLVTPVFTRAGKDIVKKSEFGIPTVVGKGKDVYSIVGGRGTTRTKIFSIEKGKFIETEATFGFSAPGITSKETATRMFGKSRIIQEGEKGFGGTLKITPKTSKTFIRSSFEQKVPVFFKRVPSKTKFSSVLKVRRDVKTILSESKGGEGFIEKGFGGTTQRFKVGDIKLVGVKGGDVVKTSFKIKPKKGIKKTSGLIFEKAPTTKVKIKERGFIKLLQPKKDTGVKILSSVSGKKTPLSKTFQEQVTTTQVTPVGIAPQIEKSLIKTTPSFKTSPSSIGGGAITKTIPQQKVRTSQFQTAITSTGLDTGLKEREKTIIKSISIPRSESSTRTKLAPASAFAQPTALKEKLALELQQKSRLVQQQKSRLVQPLFSPQKTPRGEIGRGSLRGFRLPNLNLNLRLPKQTTHASRSRKRKPTPRLPSLFAIGRGIKSTGFGSLETSALTIRPIIITKRRKKSGKKKKR